MSANLISVFKFAPRLFRKASAGAVASVFLASGVPAHAYGLDDPHDDVFLTDPVEQGDRSPAPKPQRQVSPEEFRWQGPAIALSRPDGTLAGSQADVATLRDLIAAPVVSEASVPMATGRNERAAATHDENGQKAAKQSTDAASQEQMETSRTSVAAMSATQTMHAADPATPVRTNQVPDSVLSPDADKSTEHDRTPESPPRLESAQTSSPAVSVASLADGAKNVASAPGAVGTATVVDTAGGADTAAVAHTTDGVDTAAVAVTGDGAGSATVAETGDGADTAAAADTDDANISSTTDSAATIKGKSPQSVETVEVFARKLLQEKLRNEAAKAAAKAAAPSTAPAQLPRNLGMIGPANLELVYIVGQGNRARAYVRIDNQYTRMWEPGEFVAGWRLLEVGNDYVDVIQGDDQSRLYLSSGRKDKVSAR